MGRWREAPEGPPKGTGRRGAPIHGEAGAPQQNSTCEATQPQ
jgi:hypothetical protein